MAIGEDDGAVGPVGDQTEQIQPLPPFDLGGDVPDEGDGAALTVDLDTRKRKRGADPAAVLAIDRDLGARDGVVAVHPTGCCRFNMMLLQVLEPQTADMATEHVGAVQPPDQFSRGVEIADAKIAIDDDGGIVGAFKRCQQDIRGFDHRAIVCAHRPTLMPVSKPSGLVPRWRELMLAAYRSNGVKKLVRFLGAGRKDIILKNSLTFF